MSSLRSLRRQKMREEKNKYQRMLAESTVLEMNKRLLQQGIGQEDLDRASDDGRKAGFKEGGAMMTRTCYAAAIRVLKRDFGFGEEQLIRFLTEMDLMTLTVLDHQEMVEETLDETGILLKLEGGVERVQRKTERPVLCPRCALGDKTAGGFYDCDALDGITAGRAECEHFAERDK